MIQMNNYYVYEWFIVDTLEVFHVGKGKDNRMYSTSIGRNDYFKRIVNKYDCEVRLYKSNLSEEEAYMIERERIAELKAIGQAKTNFHIGGKGGDTWTFRSDESKKDQVEKWRTTVKENNSLIGESNPFYGKKHSEEFLERHSQYMKTKMIGENNGMYGKNHSQESIEKISENRKGKAAGHNNGMAVKVVAYLPNGAIIQKDSFKELVVELIEEYNISYSLCKKILSSGQSYKPTKNALAQNKLLIHLEGLIIKKIS